MDLPTAAVPLEATTSLCLKPSLMAPVAITQELAFVYFPDRISASSNGALGWNIVCEVELS